MSSLVAAPALIIDTADTWGAHSAIPVGEQTAATASIDGVRGRVWSDGGRLHWRSDDGATDSAPASSMTHFEPKTRVQAALRAAHADAPKGLLF